jgi:predicted metal-dependent peptidase
MSDVLPGVSPEDEAAFQQKFDIARMLLERKHRWAKRTLRNLEPVARAEGALAVDKHLRLYWGPQALEWEGAEFVGALWHEVNHILRHHHDRLDHLPAAHKHMDKGWVNVAADLEVNDDLLAQGVTLPEGVMSSETFDHTPNQTAEAHYMQFVEEQPPPPPGGGGKAEGDEGDGEGESEGSGEGEAEGDGSGDQDGDGEGQPGQAPPTSCGSGAGGEPLPDELPEPDKERQSQLERESRKQDEDVQEAVQQNGGALPPGMGREVYEAAVEHMEKSDHDWRKTFAAVVRAAIEQRADEAEEYTFKRRSRRQDALGDDFVLPGSYRPIPKLAVYCDVSGSMDQAKLAAAMREVHGILVRLAIPQFEAVAWNQGFVSTTTVSSNSDVQKVFRRTGGGTDMQAAVEHGLEQGAEVLVVLTDNETAWDTTPPGVPVILGGIDRRDNGRGPDKNNIPTWTVLVDVESAAERGDDYGY